MTVRRLTWRVANGVSLRVWTFSSQTRDSQPSRCSVFLARQGVATMVGSYRMLRWMLFPDRYTDLLISYRYLGSLMFYNIFAHVAYVVGAPLASAPSLTHCKGHRTTPTIPTSRLCTPPNQHHDLDCV